MGVHEGEEGYGERGAGGFLERKLQLQSLTSNNTRLAQQHSPTHATPPPPPGFFGKRGPQDETVPFKVLNKLTGAVNPRGLIGPV